MPVATVADLVEAIDSSRVLLPDQLDKLRRELQPRFPDPPALTRELIRLGWLTPYQAQLLLQGQGANLVLGPYVLLAPLGEGGMGSVFKARHQLMRRTVALKVIRKGHLPHPDAVKRFEQEVRAASQLQHPNIVVAFDAGRAGDSHFFAMEYVEGTDLGQILAKHGPFPVPYACDCARQAALALEHAHEQGLVHRDIKPANLLLAKGGSQNGSRAVIKVLDMGLARLRYDPANKGSKALTQLGAVMGSPNYIAPEQTLDAHAVDTRADVYSLGCTLYHLLSGQVPFPDGDLATKLRQHQNAQPRPLRELRPEVPEGLATVVAKMMAKRPEDRYPTPAAAAAALEAFAGAEPARAAAPPAPVPPLRAPAAPRPAAAGAQPLAAAIAVAPAAASAASPAREAQVTTAGPAPLPPTPEPQTNGQDAAAGAIPGAAATPTTPSRRRRWIAGGVAALLLLLLWLFWPRSHEPEAGRAKDKHVTNSLGMRFALVPPGEFLMGSPLTEAGRHPTEGPQRRIHMSGDYYLGVHEVTQGNFQKVMGFNPSLNKDKDGGPSFPVENVSWSQVQEFCAKLSELPEEKQAKRTYRMPTAAEWEYACRAGSEAPFSTGKALAPWDANFDSTKPYGTTEKGKPVKHTMKVGSFPANKFGLHDLHGNVWEWTADWFDGDYYKNESVCPSTDPPGPVFGPFRVFRGGGFNSAGVDARAAVRWPGGTTHATNLGFRVVCETESPRLFPPLKFGEPLRVSPDDQYVKALNPANLPPENKFDGLPKALVWVLGEHRVRHDMHTVLALAFNPDETLLASGSVGDNTIRLGDPATLRELKTIPLPQPAQVLALRFSPDGKTLASGTSDKMVRFWDPAKGTLVRSLEGHTAAVCCLAYSADGKLLASGGHDGKVRLWDAATGDKVKAILLEGQGARTVEFSPDGKQLLTGGNPGEGTVRLWDLETGKNTLVHDFRTVTGANRTAAEDKTTYVGAAFSPDGKEIVAGCSDKSVTLFNTADRKALFKGAAPGPVVSIAFAPDGQTFASAAYVNGAGGVLVWDRKQLAKRFDYGGYLGQSNSLCYYPKSTRLAFPQTYAPGADTMLVWDTAKGQQIRPPYGHFSSASMVLFSPEGRYVLTSSARDQTYRRWDLHSNAQLQQVSCYGGVLALAPDGAFAVSHSGVESLSLWDFQRNTITRHFQGEMSNAFTAAAVSPDARYVAGGGNDRTVRVWNVATGKLAQRLPGFSNYVQSVVFTPGGNEFYAAAVHDNLVGLWNLETGSKVREFGMEGGLRSRLALSRDGTRLLAGNGRGDLVVWETRQGRASKVRPGHKGPVLGVAISPDGRRYASSGEDGKVYLWEADGQQPTLLAQLPWSVPDVAFSPDGQYLAFSNTHFTGTAYILRLPGKGP